MLTPMHASLKIGGLTAGLLLFFLHIFYLNFVFVKLTVTIA